MPYDIQSPQVDNLPVAFGKALTLGNAMRDGQLQEQAVRQGKLTLEKMQEAADDDKAINDAVAQHTTLVDGAQKLDHDGAIAQLNGQGLGRAALQLGATVQAQATAAAKGAEAASDAETKRLGVVRARAERMGQLFQGVKDAPPEGKQAAYDLAHRTGLQEGIITAQDQAQFPALYDPSQDPHIDQLVTGAQSVRDHADLQLKTLVDNSTLAGNAIDQKKKLQDAAENWRVSAANQASLALSQQDLDGIRARLVQQGAPPAAMAQIPLQWSPEVKVQLARAARTSEQNAQIDQAAANAAQTAARDAQIAKDETARRGMEQQRIGLEQQRLGIEQGREAIARVQADPTGALGLNKNAKTNPGGDAASGIAFLGTLSPSMAARVQAIADGREAPLSTGGGAAKVNGPIMAAVEQFDPTWSKERAAVRHAFAVGPDGRNIGALNTATVHLGQLHEAAMAMQNNSWQPGNAVYNYFRAKFGEANITNYNYVMNALAGETASALKGNATDPEIAHVLSTIHADLSMGQATGVAISGLHVMGAKMQTYNERYHQQMPDDPWTPVLPSARAVFSRFGLDPTAPAEGATPATSPGRGSKTPAPAAKKITVIAGDGSVHPFDSEQQAAAFEAAVKQANGTTKRQ